MLLTVMEEIKFFFSRTRISATNTRGSGALCTAHINVNSCFLDAHTLERKGSPSVLLVCDAIKRNSVQNNQVYSSHVAESEGPPRLP